MALTESNALTGEKTYLVREFAKRAGVTVRTLHYYDEAGLLKPSAHTAAGHRLYREGDLLRLQQILTLKYMGFSLEDISALLNSPSYDVRRSLRIQKDAIDQRIAQLQLVSRALQRTLETISSENETLEWGQVSDIIQGVLAEDKQQWVSRYYTPEQQAYLSERAQQFSEEQVAEWAQMWTDLIAGFETVLAAGMSPQDPESQRLAARMAGYVEEFTGGDEGLTNSLRAMWSDFDQIPPEYRLHSVETQRFMCASLAVYWDL